MVDDTWSSALHRLWQAASRAEEVAALADDVYAPLLATRGSTSWWARGGTGSTSCGTCVR